MNTNRAAAILKAAAEAVKESGVPANLRAPAFEKAVDLLSPGEAERADITDDKQTEDKRKRKHDEGAVDSTDLVPRIAAKLKVDQQLVEDVYAVDDGELKVVVAASKLEKTKAGATKQLALLVAAGRQGAGLETWTQSDELREVAKDFGKFDVTNFGKQLRELDDPFNFTGSGTNIKVKVNRGGWEAATALVTKLAGGDKS